MLESEVDKNPEAKGFIFDGFPRTETQAQALDEFLGKKDTEITMMLALQVKDEELKDRLLKRAETSGRSDDADPKIIANRIEVYKAETAPVANYYKEQHKLRVIDGMGSIDQISQRLYDAIDQHGEQ